MVHILSLTIEITRLGFFCSLEETSGQTGTKILLLNLYIRIGCIMLYTVNRSRETWVHKLKAVGSNLGQGGFLYIIEPTDRSDFIAHFESVALFWWTYGPYHRIRNVRFTILFKNAVVQKLLHNLKFFINLSRNNVKMISKEVLP